MNGRARSSLTLGFRLLPWFLVLVVGFTAGAYADQALPDWIPYVAHSSGRIDLSAVQQASRFIEADYVDPNVDASKLSHATVQGLIAGLNDPFSAYFDPEQYKKLQQS